MLRRHRLLITLLAALAVVLLGAGVISAQSGTPLEKLHAGETVTIGPEETVEGDLYVFAGTVRIAGSIQGDLVATGGQVDIPGTVGGDVLVAGGQVTVGGTVEGDVRAAAGTLTIAGTVGEDALIAGGTVAITTSGNVGEDVIVSAGTLSVDGIVAGSVVGTAGTYQRSGQIGGIENVQLTNTRTEVQPTPSSRVADAVRHFLVVLLVGALLLWLAPRTYASLQSTLRARPVAAAGWGLVGLIGAIALVIVIAIVMVVLAVPLGILGFGSLVAFLVLAGTLAIGVLCLGLAFVIAFVADAIVGAVIASLIPQDQRSSRWQELGLLAAGAAVVVFVTSLPIVGPWLKLAVAVLGLGALLLVATAGWRGRRSGGAPAPPPEEGATTV